MNMNGILEKLNHQREMLSSNRVKSLAIFGSYARGEATKESDIDILVEFDRSIGIFEFVRLKLILEDLLDIKVDLVTPDAIRPSMREQILEDAFYVT